MIHLTRADYRVMPWANGKGVTVELAKAERDGAILSQRDGVQVPIGQRGAALLKALLEAEGCFDPGRKRPLPALPARVWWLLLPAILALLGGITTLQLSAGLLLYRY